MKSEQNVSFSIDGTSALKVDHCPQRTQTATIIDFPGIRQRTHSRRDRMPASTPIGVAKARMRGILETSEMYCSLKFEDARGFQYNRFNAKGIAFLSSATALIAIVAIVAGA